MSSKRWKKGLVWLRKQSRSSAGPLTWLWEQPSTLYVPWGFLWLALWRSLGEFCVEFSQAWHTQREFHQGSGETSTSNNVGVAFATMQRWIFSFSEALRSSLDGGKGSTKSASWSLQEVQSSCWGVSTVDLSVSEESARKGLRLRRSSRLYSQTPPPPPFLTGYIAIGLR